MKFALITAFSFALVLPLCFAQQDYYEWPLTNVSSREITGTFCEYRPNHLHEGIDIPASYGKNVKCAYSPWLMLGAYKVVEKEHNGGWYVTVQHYVISDDLVDTTEMPSGSRYLHISNEPDIQVGTIYLRDTLIAENTEYYHGHLHFEIREPEPESDNYKNSCNPFGEDSCLRPTDNFVPYLDYLYVDADSQGNATVSLWNFLHYFFDSYYNSTIAAPFIQCLLETESIDNDLDDPHFLISAACMVRFVLKTKDRAGESGSSSPNCAPYHIALYLDTALATESDEIPFIEDTSPFYEVMFDQLINMDNENEKWDEEDVYHTEYPLESHIATNPDDTTRLYYRLYPLDKNGDGLPGCIITGDAICLRTEDMEEGIHRIRIYVKDYMTNDKTGDAHFYIRRSEWVDFCRGFTE